MERPMESPVPDDYRSIVNVFMFRMPNFVTRGMVYQCLADADATGATGTELIQLRDEAIDDLIVRAIPDSYD